MREAFVVGQDVDLRGHVSAAIQELKLALDCAGICTTITAGCHEVIGKAMQLLAAIDSTPVVAQ